MSGIGPGTGVAEAGAIICCAEAPDMPVAASTAAVHTLCMSNLVMSPPPCCPARERDFSWLAACEGLLCSSLPDRLASARNDADAAGEGFRHREPAVDDLERQRRQRPGSGTVDDGGSLARIVVRVVAGAFEDLLLRAPDIHLA